MKHAILLSVVCLLILSACGRKGPLSLAPEPQPAAVEAFAVKQVGLSLEASWSFPAMLSDGRTPLDPARVSKVVLYYHDREVPVERFWKKADDWKTFKAKELIRRGERSFAVRVPLPNPAVTEAQAWFALRFWYGRNKAPESAVLSIHLVQPPRPVDKLTVTAESKINVLQWNRPVLDTAGKPLQTIVGYKVYRRISGETEFTDLTPEPLVYEYFEDVETGKEGTYEYFVSALAGKTVESEGAKPVTVTVSDVYPPDVPKNLVSFQARDHIFLSWEAVRDDDFSHYRVYRKTSAAAEFVRVADNVKEPLYRDYTVKAKGTYFYCVSSVDHKGNESNRSGVVQENYEK